MEPLFPKINNVWAAMWSWHSILKTLTISATGGLFMSTFFRAFQHRSGRLAFASPVWRLACMWLLLLLSPFTAFDSCNERAGHTWLHLHQRWQIYPESFICSNWRVSLLLQWIKHSKEVYFAPFSHICHYTVRLSQYFQPHFSQTHNKNVIILRKRMKYNCTITEN